MALKGAHLAPAFQEHAKDIERMSWRHMDCEQFSASFLPLLKSLAKLSTRIRKSETRRAVATAKLNLTGPEAEELTNKVSGSISYAKRKLRDAGSGKFLPPAVQALLRIWLPKGKKGVCKATLDRLHEVRSSTVATRTQAPDTKTGPDTTTMATMWLRRKVRWIHCKG